jgi:hypothetical protein
MAEDPWRKSSSRMMDRYSGLEDDESIGNYSDSLSEESPGRTTESRINSARMTSDRFTQPIIHSKSSKPLKKSYDSFGFKDDTSRKGLEFRTNFPIKIEPLSSDSDSDDATTLHPHIRPTTKLPFYAKPQPPSPPTHPNAPHPNPTYSPESSFNFIPKHHQSPLDPLDYKSNNTNATNQFASLNENNKTFSLNQNVTSNKTDQDSKNFNSKKNANDNFESECGQSEGGLGTLVNKHSEL